METLAQEWGMALLRGTGGGLVLAAVAFGACRLLPRLTAPVRFWLWWLVAAKFVIGLALAVGGVTALRVPVLSAEHYRQIRRLASRTTAKTVRTVAAHVPVAHPIPARTVRPIAPRAATDSAPLIVRYATTTQRTSARSRISTMAIPCVYDVAMVLYLLGLTVFLARIGQEGLLLRRLLDRAVRCDNADLLSEVAAMAVRLGLPATPRLLLSSEIAAPLVTGIARPAIVLPSSLADASPALRRLALAHEMAHLRRGDLTLAIVPTIARALFWFLPVVHFAVREAALAREEACDLIAVRTCETSPSVYGSLLVSVAARQTATLPYPALGMASAASPGFAQIKRRLKTLQREADGRSVPFVWRGVAMTLVLAQGAVTLLPLQPALARAAFAARAAMPDVDPLPHYVLTDLGTLGGRHSGAFAVNDAGLVVGTANIYPLGERGHAFVHDGKAIRDLAAGSVYRHSVALSISDTGMIAGAAFRSSYRSGEQTAFVWNGKQRIYLPPTTNFHFARANGINDAGVVVGASLGGATDEQGATIAHATLWKDGQPRDLGTLGGRYSQATAIAANGLIVGKADVSDDDIGTRRTHPFVYAGDAMRDLGTLGGANGAACAVTESGTAVGYAETSYGDMHAFAVDTLHGDEPHDLGTIPGYPASAAYGISRNGRIVGQASGPGAPAHAVLWRKAGTPAIDLNDLLTTDVKSAGWQLETARGINAQGQIVGQGIIGGKRHAFLLTPVK